MRLPTIDTAQSESLGLRVLEDTMPTLVRLPARSPAGSFEIISPDSVALISTTHNGQCVVYLKGHSEEAGFWILLDQDEVASRLGIKVVDRIE